MSSRAWRDAAVIGLAVGACWAILGVMTTQWWLLASLPAGAAAGPAAARWIRPTSGIPIKALAVGGLIADVVGAWVVAAALDIVASVRDGVDPPWSLAVRIATDGLIAIGFAGAFGLVLTIPSAAIGIWLLRRWRTSRTTARAS